MILFPFAMKKSWPVVAIYRLFTGIPKLDNDQVFYVPSICGSIKRIFLSEKTFRFLLWFVSLCYKFCLPSVHFGYNRTNSNNSKSNESFSVSYKREWKLLFFSNIKKNLSIDINFQSCLFVQTFYLSIQKFCHQAK